MMKHWRTLIQVMDIEDSFDGPILVLQVPAWDPYEPVRLSVASMDRSRLGDIGVGMYLFCEARIGADGPEGLDMRCFEHAPEPVTNECLMRWLTMDPCSVPLPGSDEGVAQGCTCTGAIYRRGGFSNDKMPRPSAWIITPECPVHDTVIACSIEDARPGD